MGCFPYSRNRRQFGIFFLFLLIEGFSFSPRFYLLLVGEGMLSKTKFSFPWMDGGVVICHYAT